MKTHYFLPLILVALRLDAVAGPEKEWQSKSDLSQVIRAEIVAKSLDGKKLQFKYPNKNIFWYSADSFAEKHQKYFKNWIKPDEHLDARVIKSGDHNQKTIEVKARAGSQKMVVKVFRHYKSSVSFKKTIEPGKELVFQFSGTEKYAVRAFWGDEQVDYELWNKKTGTLQGAKGLSR